jgi:hypothetical protein
MHPRLPADVALIFIGRAALALGRGGHASGVHLHVDLEQVETKCELSWIAADLGKLVQHDENRITEDGAEAVALAAVHSHRGWRVVRRMQREECPDWWLEHTGEGSRQTIALEVSGIARGAISARLSQKLAQVAKSEGVNQRWAAVVGFQRPKASIRSSEARKRGN